MKLPQIKFIPVSTYNIAAYTQSSLASLFFSLELNETKKRSLFCYREPEKCKLLCPENFHVSDNLLTVTNL